MHARVSARRGNLETQTRVDASRGLTSRTCCWPRPGRWWHRAERSGDDPRRCAMNRDEAERSLANTDWTNATVDREPRQVSIVHSVRFPAELSKKLEAEAE